MMPQRKDSPFDPGVAVGALLQSGGLKADADNVVRAAGILGLLGSPSFCVLGCHCAEEHLFCERAIGRAQRIGLALMLRRDGIGDRADRVSRVWSCCGNEYDVRVTHRGRPEWRDTIRGLLDFVADLQHPPVRLDCVRRRDLWVGRGLSAYSVWDAAMAGCSRLSAQRRQAITSHAAAWIPARQMAARYLLMLAGSRRQRWANDLREAGALAASEAAIMQRELVENIRAQRVSGVRDSLRECAFLAASVHKLTARAAMIAIQLDDGLAEELLRNGDEAPDEYVVGQLVYLARAATEPLRRLAIARLARSFDPQARATLRETANDASRDVSEVARWALQRQSDQVSD